MSGLSPWDLKGMQPLNVEILDVGVTGLESYNDRMKGTYNPSSGIVSVWSYRTGKCQNRALKL